MPKLKLEDLAKIKEKVKTSTGLREGGYQAKVTVHMGTCGIASGARKVMQKLMDEIAQRDVKDVIVTTSGCAGLCSREPMATVELRGEAPVKYVDLDEEKIQRILVEHVVGGKIVEEYALAIGSETSY
ncbi:MAG: (2Fe-2S) ferredoxin domain-containing protein [Deltaproteobacteria bacterium]|jgi:NADP-reducing hydrogenase subunit HndB|nr:(2Fe-2S) ferredoxin domain-containing protein [Deltaproteobacteria bacterium]MBW2553631.1 (2Fe-2S) ferredoxin domain-containing protein [Deltaproteobacteria bacterium]MCK5421785.1 (2Fe-2S) ferredoxin domain-containing protein [Deltaproteobacteria bacterium]MCK5514640.1 (2Fe-2S) ferredoxin domain-containing protein [Deltaproteobacteria bacterium]NOQ85427.1 (2Fe-2S) ferredoxin domain-containing protein [Deltaproteobacteria bacterium]